MLQLSAIIHDRKTTSLPTPEFHIKKKKKKKKIKKKKRKEKKKRDNLTTYKSIYDVSV